MYFKFSQKWLVSFGYFPSFQLLALEAFGKHRLREQMSYQCNPRLPAMGSIFLFPLLDFQNMLPLW